jgi:hypothetical protein
VASVKKLPNGLWKARYRQPDGRERAKHFPTRKAAADWLTEVEGTKLDGSWTNPDGGKTLFRDWVDVWKASTVHLRPSSRARDDAYLRSLVLPVFGNRKLGTITQPEVRAWVADVAKTHAPATTVKAGWVCQPRLAPPRSLDLAPPRAF